MLELAILGFLHDAPLHGYVLRRHIAALTGHVRPVAESTLYPAIKRLEKAGLLVRATEPGAVAAPRHVLSLTEQGRQDLRRRLADPGQREITDENQWFTLLAFLRHLEDPEAQAAVLRRRLAFLQEPASFFYDGDRPLAAEDLDDPFRRGVLTIARATSRAELAWLRDTLASLESVGG
ncbi:PadR family transcriptional regulator [Streptomyces collinus]|uniref:PadR-like family transcriptional regulator n=1 Tax=Streptomyces collinus (strain DSM 40733 / Tue 365) TaxID=1214242 RepID=S5VHU4_STRC3|nr:PadR family transcriptional regulator [Streptomyces collinus]AGS68010.1 PadR-like family transcriptional regulator [Streptomyces collinus Tu 365]UJA06647.1 PadR family transcriptional regulator [Streptomyces collinus]UJA12182.1 PadR family transcriptional regulator [Streptomyces collinus]UJA12952.1 PadR family transcriptional regulator [Streptomyces collinus]UJA18486.1 PadR family transcriptional regulator [Streptomyces collinus]